MFFNTPFLHFRTLHTFTSLFYICTYGKFLSSFWLDNDRSSVEKSRTVLPLDFNPHCFQKPLLLSTYYFLQKREILCSLEQNYNKFYTCFHTGRESVLPVTPYVTYHKNVYFAQPRSQGLFVFAFLTTMETLGTRLIFRVLVLVFI